MLYVPGPFIFAGNSSIHFPQKRGILQRGYGEVRPVLKGLNVVTTRAAGLPSALEL